MGQKATSINLFDRLVDVQSIRSRFKRHEGRRLVDGPGHAPLRAAVPQTASRRPPNRRALTCTWVLDAQSGQLFRRWTLEPFG